MEKQKQLTFFDVCSGIGGGRLGLEMAGLKCIGHSEIDPIPDFTYNLFFGKEDNYGDLMEINTSLLPDFDFLIGGFPCQTFSIVGKRAGFLDKRGQVIFGIEKILREKNVSCFILENVKGLVNHDKGRSLKQILILLENAGYNVYYKVISSIECGIPQLRERVYFCGIRKDLQKKIFKFPSKVSTKNISEFLVDEKAEIFDTNNPTFIKYLNNKYNHGKIDLNLILNNDNWIIDTRQSDLRIQKEFCPTLRTGRQGILYVKNRKLRVLSGKESLLLQGFPVELANKAQGVIAETRIKAQAGNAMTVNAIYLLANEVIKCL